MSAPVKWGVSNTITFFKSFEGFSLENIDALLADDFI